MQIKKSAVCEIAGASWRVAAILVSTTTSRSLYLRVVAGCESGCLQSFSILEVCGVACTTPYSLSQRESKVKQPSFFSIVYPRYNLNVIIFKFLQCCKLILVTYHPILCAKPAFNCSNVLLIRYVQTLLDREKNRTLMYGRPSFRTDLLVLRSYQKFYVFNKIYLRMSSMIYRKFLTKSAKAHEKRCNLQLYCHDSAPSCTI